MECTCRIPELSDHNSYMAAIEALPLVQTPEVFGLHANADIAYYTSATKALWRNLVGFLWPFTIHTIMNCAHKRLADDAKVRQCLGRMQCP